MATVIAHLDVFWAGLRMTLALIAISSVLSLAAGTVLAAIRVSPVPLLRHFGEAYVEIARNTPLTIIFFFSAFVLPQLGASLSYFTYAVIALTVYYAAFFCEAIRSGLNIVPRGQAEAARSIGLGFFGVLRYVILPQAFRTVIPPLINVLIALIKSTAVASAFGVAELLTMMEQLVTTESDAVIAIMVATALFYLMLTLPAAAAASVLERRLRVER